MQVGYLDAFGPILAQLFQRSTRRRDCFDDIRSGPLFHLKRKCRLPVDARVARRILEGAADGGDVLECHHRISAHLYRNFHDVLQVLDQARHLEHDAPAPRLDGPSRNQTVVPLKLADQLIKAQVVGLENRRVDQYLKEFVPRAANLDLQNAGQPFDGFLRVIGDGVQRSLWHRPRNERGDNREERGVDLCHREVIGVFGQISLDPVCGFPDFAQRFVDVSAGGEFKLDVRIAFGCVALDLLKPGNRGEFGFHRLDQQAFGIRRADPFKARGDVNKR